MQHLGARMTSSRDYLGAIVLPSGGHLADTVEQCTNPLKIVINSPRSIGRPGESSDLMVMEATMATPVLVPRRKLGGPGGC